MKLLALALALALHATGAWSHLPLPVREAVARPATAQLETHPPARPTAVTAWPLPTRTGAEPLQLSAGSSILAVDTTTGQPLYSQNPGQPRPIASITKLMTALVILSRHSLDETVTIPPLPTYNSQDVTLGLMPGERYRLADLVRATLVISANDAADALAIFDSGSIPKFAAHMNHKAATWNLTQTRFAGASGLQDDDNYATAESLARLAGLALKNPFIRDTIPQTGATLISSAGRTLSGETSNKLLATGRYYGIKTGYTLAAGQCFLGLTRINGHSVITVVLGSPDRFGETEQLYHWLNRNYQWL